MSVVSFSVAVAFTSVRLLIQKLEARQSDSRFLPTQCSDFFLRHSSASWVEATNTLLLTVSADVAAYASVSVNISENLGIRLPSEGLTMNTASLQIATDAVSDGELES